MSQEITADGNNKKTRTLIRSIYHLEQGRDTNCWHLRGQVYSYWY